MSLRGTFALVILAVGMVLLSLFFKNNQQRNPGDPLFDINEDKITLITIVDGNDTHILKRTEGEWRIEITPPDRADARYVERLIKAIKEVKPVDILNQRELKSRRSLSSLGLENSKRSLTIQQEDGKTQTLTFGNEGVGDKQFFARLNNRGDVFIIPSTLPEIAFRPNDDFRDHSLTSLQPSELTQLRVQQGMGEFRAVFKNDHWVMTQPTEASIKREALEAWITPLLNAPIEARLGSNEGNLSSYGLDQPRAEMTLFSENRTTPTILSLGKVVDDKNDPGKKSVYVRSSVRHSIFKISANVEKIFMISPDTLRTRDFFHLNLDTVDRIIISQGSCNISLRRQADAAENWISDGEYAIIIPGEKMQTMIAALEKNSILAFQPATSGNLMKSGLAANPGPAATIQFLSHLSENTPDDDVGDYPVLKIIFGISQESGRPSLFARIDDMPDILEIPVSVMDLPIWKMGRKEDQ
ncbi:MAG: DUF4340 domain-containing protein [Chthoniobacterales bacterium]